MKKKILSIAIIMIILFTNYAIAADATIKYTRDTSASNLRTIAQLDNDDLYLANKFNAKSLSVSYSKIKIYGYNTTTEQTCHDMSTIASDSDKPVYTFGTLVYDEIIVIKKCGMDINVAAEIALRGRLEVNSIGLKK